MNESGKVLEFEFLTQGSASAFAYKGRFIRELRVNQRGVRVFLSLRKAVQS